jgi:hypothetical protein
LAKSVCRRSWSRADRKRFNSLSNYLHNQNKQTLTLYLRSDPVVHAAALDKLKSAAANLMQQGPVMTVMQADHEQDKSNKRISFSVASLLADTRPPSPASHHEASAEEDEEDDVSVLGTPPSSPAPSTSGADDDRGSERLASSPLSSSAAAPHSLAGIMAHVVAPVRPTPFSLAYGQHPAWSLHPSHHNPFGGPFGGPGGISPFVAGLTPGSGEYRFCKDAFVDLVSFEGCFEG